MSRTTPALLLATASLSVLFTLHPVEAQLRLADESDRQAFLRWFVYVADARFYAPAPDVTDCAALVRHAWREALREHTPEWRRRAALPAMPAYPDVRRRPPVSGAMWPLFRVSARPSVPLQEFADARALIQYNTRPVARTWEAARPGDLLAYHQVDAREPDHVMIVVGRSLLDSSASDFVVYHTGPDDRGPGEMRKVRMGDLLRHPAHRWRPVPDNPAFVGVFRPAVL